MPTVTLHTVQCPYCASKHGVAIATDQDLRDAAAELLGWLQLAEKMIFCESLEETRVLTQIREALRRHEATLAQDKTPTTNTAEQIG